MWNLETVLFYRKELKMITLQTQKMNPISFESRHKKSDNKEIKSDSTIIRFDDRDIVSKDKNKEIINILIGIIIKNFQNILE